MWTPETLPVAGHTLEDMCGPFSDQSEVLVVRTGGDRLATLGQFRPTAASIALQRYGPKGPKEILLIERSRPPGEHQWTIAGGKRERVIPGSPYSPLESIVMTALREFNEETGIRLLLGELGSIILGWAYPDHRVAIFETFLWTDDHRWSQPPICGDGVMAARWVDQEQMEFLSLTPMAKECVPFFFV